DLPFLTPLRRLTPPAPAYLGSVAGCSNDYVAFVRSCQLEAELRGPWALFGRSARVEGWKLHLSSTPRDARRLLEAAVPLLRDEAVPFKIARDEATLNRLNEGLLGAT